MKSQIFEEDCGNKSWLEVGDFASFRYVDADQYDPEKKEVFRGLIIEVTWEDASGDKMDWPAYRVLVNGGFWRWFPHYELWDNE